MEPRGYDIDCRTCAPLSHWVIGFYCSVKLYIAHKLDASNVFCLWRCVYDFKNDWNIWRYVCVCVIITEDYNTREKEKAPLSNLYRGHPVGAIVKTCVHNSTSRSAETIRDRGNARTVTTHSGKRRIYIYIRERRWGPAMLYVTGRWEISSCGFFEGAIHHTPRGPASRRANTAYKAQWRSIYSMCVIQGPDL